MNLVMPKLHDGSDYPLCLAVGSESAHPGEALFNMVLGSQMHKLV